MIDDARREERRKVIGCSDIASIITDPATGKAVSPWGTPYKVWRSKHYGEDEPETPQMRFGSVAEAFIADEYMLETGREVYEFHPMLRRGWIGGSIDRAVRRPGDPCPVLDGKLVTKLGLECKTCGELTPWTEIPLYYRLQVQGYLYLVDTAEAWDLMVLYRSTMKFDTFTEERDPEFATSIVPILEEWAERYIGRFDPNDPPPAVCEDDCKREWKRRKPDLVSIPVTDALYDAISRIKAAEARKKEAEAEIAELREGVVLAMANAKDENGRGAEAVVGYDGKPLVTYKAPKPSRKTDWQGLGKSALAEGLIGTELVEQFTAVTEGAPRFLVK